MADRLKALLSFTGLVVNTPVVRAHGLHWGKRSVQPDIAEVLDGNAPYTITADATNLTITRLTGAPADVNVLVESWHSLERAFNSNQVLRLSNSTLVVQGGGGGGGGATVFTDGITSFGDGSVGNPISSWGPYPDIADNPGVEVLFSTSGLRITGHDGATPGNQFTVQAANGSIVRSVDPGGGQMIQTELGGGTTLHETGPAQIGQFGAGGVTGSFNDVQLDLLTDTGIVSDYWTVPTGAGGVTFTGIDSVYNSGVLLKFGFPRRKIFNTGVGNLTLKNASGSSALGNRFSFVGAADVVVPPAGCAVVQRIEAGAGITNVWMLEAKSF